MPLDVVATGNTAATIAGCDIILQFLKSKRYCAKFLGKLQQHVNATVNNKNIQSVEVHDTHM